MNRKALVAALGVAVAVGAGVVAARAQRQATTRRARPSVLWNSEDGAWLGIRLRDVTADDVKNLKLPGEYGAIVSEVEEDSPAAKAGLEKGDVVLTFAGEQVWSTAGLARMVRETPPGRTVRLEISRAGKMQALTVVPKEREEASLAPYFRMEMPHVEINPMPQVPNFDFNLLFPGRPRLGVSVDDLPPQLAEYFGVPEGKGVLVREVMPDTPAQKAGLKAGDCIVKVGDKPVGSVEELHEALANQTPNGREVTLTIVRGHHEQTVNVRFEKPEAVHGPVAQTEGFKPEEWNLMQLQKDEKKAFEDLRKNWTDQSRKWEQELRRSLESQGKEFERLRQELLRLKHDASEV